VDEKAQIQALERTRRGLPMAKDRPVTQTHDYIRRGTTTTLFATLNAGRSRRTTISSSKPMRRQN
jgi:hypothetical protein